MSKSRLELSRVGKLLVTTKSLTVTGRWDEGQTSPRLSFSFSESSFSLLLLRLWEAMNALVIRGYNPDTSQESQQTGKGKKAVPLDQPRPWGSASAALPPPDSFRSLRPVEKPQTLRRVVTPYETRRFKIFWQSLHNAKPKP